MSTIFNDNAKTLCASQQDFPSPPQNTINITGIVDTILFVGKFELYNIFI